MGRRFSLPVDGRVKLDLARDAAKLASQSVAKQGTGVIPRDVRPVDISTVLDSPSGPLRSGRYDLVLLSSDIWIWLADVRI